MKHTMTDDEALRYFEKCGKAAGFLLGCGPPAAAESGEKRQNAAMDIYLNHPHLQNKMYDIAKGFTWSLVAHMEQVRVLRELDNQRGARAC